MSRRASLLWLLPVFLLTGACGSSKHATTPGLSGFSSSSTGSSTPTSTPSTAPSTAASTTAAPAPRNTSTRPASARHPTGGAALSPGTNGSGGGATNARVPATFVIRAGSRLDPRSVSAPAFLAIQLTVVSGDGKPHRVLLRTPTPHSLSVPAHGRASVMIAGLRAGRYDIVVDGAARGALMIGGEPGP